MSRERVMPCAERFSIRSRKNASTAVFWQSLSRLRTAVVFSSSATYVALGHELIILGLHGDLLLHQLVAGMELCVFCRAADEAKQEDVCEDGEDQHHKDNEEFFGRKRVD